MEDKMMITVEEFKKLWGVSRPKAYELANSEGFPAIHIGRKILIPRKQLDIWIENQLKGAALAE